MGHYLILAHAIHLHWVHILSPMIICSSISFEHSHCVLDTYCLYDRTHFEMNKVMRFQQKLYSFENCWFLKQYYWWQTKKIRGYPKACPCYRKVLILWIGLKVAKTKTMTHSKIYLVAIAENNDFCSQDHY